MTSNTSRKEKILHLHEILLQETDDAHGLTMLQLIAALQARGIDAERKAIYDDLRALGSYGVDIVKRGGGRSVEYAIGQRDFELPELLLLIDAVQSSRFLTEKKSRALVAKLQGFASRHQASQLNKNMHVEGRIKTQNESIYYNIDAIQEAIRRKRKITFHYFEYGLNKQEILRRQGQDYLESPIELIYRDDYYYLITYNDKYEDFVRYRVDRMLDILTHSEAIPSVHKIRDFDAQEFSARSFGMFGGESLGVDLIVDRSIIGSIIDRFGKETLIFMEDENTAKAHINVLKSQPFFGWIAQFGEKITIDEPRSLAEEYQSYLRSILAQYDKTS